MIIEDRGILLGTRKFQESACIADCLLENHGLIRGYVRINRKKGIILNPGNRIKVVWKARLDSHLGSMTCENEKCLSGIIGFDSLKTMALSSITSVAMLLLQELEHQPAIYKRFIEFLIKLEDDNYDYLTAYALLEAEFLTKSGFGLDLRSCAATNSMHNLVFISPKSGRAVSQAAGEPYKDRLFHLPAFMCDETAYASLHDIASSLTALGYFLAKYIWEPNNQREPTARQQLLSHVKRLSSMASTPFAA